MKKHRIKVLIAKGWCKVVYFVSFSLLSVICNHASAQKAGEMISGRITDDEGPLMYANVCERDSLNRIVAHSVSDAEGRFSFRLVNPENTINVTLIGYESVKLPIDKMYYEIKMEQSPEQYLDNIIGSDVVTINEDLQGKVAGLNILFESSDLAYGPPVRSLMKRIDGVDVAIPLVTFDFELMDIDEAKLESFDFENKYNDRKSLAGLLGVKKSSLKAVRYLKNPKSTAIWGYRGFYGVLEILTKKQYQKSKKEGKLDDDWQILK